MANLTKKDYDTRTFSEICNSLTPDQWLVLRDRVMTRTRCSKQTILNWKSGKTIPASILEREAISGIVNRVLGINTNHNTLFLT